MNQIGFAAPDVSAAGVAALVPRCGSSSSSSSGGSSSAARPRPRPASPRPRSRSAATSRYRPAAPGYSEIAPAATAYFDYVNANGGIYGRKIIYKYLDDGYDPTKTASVVRQLVLQDNVFAIFNGLGTPTHLAAVSFLNAEKVPDLFVASGCECWNAPTPTPRPSAGSSTTSARARSSAQYIGSTSRARRSATSTRTTNSARTGSRASTTRSRLDGGQQAELRHHQRQHRPAGRRAAGVGRPGHRGLLDPGLHRAVQAGHPQARLQPDRSWSATSAPTRSRWAGCSRRSPSRAARP